MALFLISSWFYVFNTNYVQSVYLRYSSSTTWRPSYKNLKQDILNYMIYFLMSADDLLIYFFSINDLKYSIMIWQKSSFTTNSFIIRNIGGILIIFVQTPKFLYIQYFSFSWYLVYRAWWNEFPLTESKKWLYGLMN